MTPATTTPRHTMQWLLAVAVLGSMIATDAFGQASKSLSQIGTAIRTQEIARRLSAPSASAEVVVLTQRKTDVWTGEEWSLESQSVLAYDGVRRVENSEYQWFENGEFGISYRTTYSWSDLGFLTELREEWDVDAQAFENVDRYTYFFASDGETVSSMFYDVWTGSEFHYIDRTTYTLDDNLLVTGGETSQWNGTSWDAFERFTITEEGSSVVQIEQVRSGLDWANQTRTLFQDVSLAELYEKVTKFSTAFEDYLGLNYAMRFLPPMFVQEWNGIEWTNVERTVHDMNDPITGDVTRIQSLEWDTDRWIPVMRHYFEYETSTRQPTQVEVQAFDGEITWSTVLLESYEIDTMGDVAAAVVQYDLGEGLELVSRTEFNWMHIQVSREDEEVPAGYRLEAAYPNPFNPSTTIAYDMGVAGPISLRIFDALGREVATLVDGVRPAGRHEIAFSAGNLPSGRYFVRLEAPGFTQTRLVTLLK